MSEKQDDEIMELITKAKKTADELMSLTDALAEKDVETKIQIHEICPVVFGSMPSRSSLNITFKKLLYPPQTISGTDSAVRQFAGIEEF